MPRFQLKGGAYSAASLIANAQRCVNWFPEKNPADAESPTEMTHYPRPGQTLVGQPPAAGRGRGLFVSTNGNLYAFIDQNVYFIDQNFNFNLLGQLLNPGTTPVSAIDNGLNAIVVDGSPNGNNIDIFHNTMTVIGDPNFLGSVRADFIDGFIILNEPNSPNWYASLVQQIVFSALDFGTKTAWPDNVLCVVAIEREVWLFGPYRSEIWGNAGTVPFAFNVLQGVIIEHGCAAAYSPAIIDTSVYWLNQTEKGARMAMKSEGHLAKRISTHAIEKEWMKYQRVDDCVTSTYQFRGHNFVIFHFPSADRSWAFDDSTQQWYEDAFFDVNGVQHRSRVPFVANAYGKLLGLDWNNGNLYKLDQDNYTDNGIPIVLIRSMPHLLDDEDDRQTIWRVIADVESGEYPNQAGVPITVGPWSSGWSAGFGPNTQLFDPTISLRLSWDRGNSFGNYVMQPLGASGQTNKVPEWWRLGYGRDAVIEIAMAPGVRTSFNGLFVINEIHTDDRIGE